MRLTILLRSEDTSGVASAPAPTVMNVRESRRAESAQLLFPPPLYTHVVSTNKKEAQEKKIAAAAATIKKSAPAQAAPKCVSVLLLVTLPPDSSDSSSSLLISPCASVVSVLVDVSLLIGWSSCRGYSGVGPWNCEKCTTENPEHSAGCKMCGSLKPDPVIVRSPLSVDLALSR